MNVCVCMCYYIGYWYHKCQLVMTIMIFFWKYSWLNLFGKNSFDRMNIYVILYIWWYIEFIIIIIFVISLLILCIYICVTLWIKFNFTFKWSKYDNDMITFEYLLLSLLLLLSVFFYVTIPMYLFSVRFFYNPYEFYLLFIYHINNFMIGKFFFDKILLPDINH